MSDTEKDLEIESSDDVIEKESKPEKPERKTQAQILQETLGLQPTDIQDLEKKLFIARFFDYFSEETFDFIYKNRSIELYKLEIKKFLEKLEQSEREEDKLLIKSYEDKKIIETIEKIKQKAEELALNKANIKEPVDHKLRKMTLLTTLPIFGVLMIVTFLFMNVINIFFIIPLICVFCMVPQFIRASVLRKWYRFKEENKTEFYSDNRDNIMILKDYTGQILNNIRENLLEMKVPLQIIKFVLHSRDYENLKLINQSRVRGVQQFFFSFEYPPGMEPFPIPKELLEQYQTVPTELKGSKASEKNFIVLTELKAKNGVLESYLPSLKSHLSDSINQMLNMCDFTTGNKKVEEIIPNLKDMPIYCICGEMASFINIQICNWKNQFKFYLFESEDCNCGEKLYVISLMNDNDEIPENLIDIFSS